jgi:aminoglycoside phosphotransferase (APT) family kinase protein
VVRIGAGLDNVAYEVNGELVVRFAVPPDPERLVREARLLTAVARVSPLPVPVPRFTAPERGCLAYVRLPGVPLLDLPRGRRAEHAAAIGATLGELLAALHTVPPDWMTALVGTDHHPLGEWLDEAAELFETVAEQVPPARRPAIEAFLGASPPDEQYTPVFSHNDLGIEHVLVDPTAWTVTGIIDWSDAAIVDPAYDVGLLYRDLGPDALRSALRRMEADALHDRAVFYARCSVFEDMAYAAQTGRDAYLDKSLAALDWLFPG